MEIGQMTPEEVEAVIRGNEKWKRQNKLTCKFCNKKLKHNSPNNFYHKQCLIFVQYN